MPSFIDSNEKGWWEVGVYFIIRTVLLLVKQISWSEVKYIDPRHVGQQQHVLLLKNGNMDSKEGWY